MLELTDTFAVALERAKAIALAKQELGLAEQESLLALPGFDGSPYLTFLEELRAGGVEIESADDEISESPEALSPVTSRKNYPEESSPDLDLLNRYMQELGRYPLLTVDEEKRYAREAQKGNDRSRTQLILGNLRLVVYLARRYRNRGLPFLDLIGEGNIGLIRGADRFDPERGVRFSTYVSWWIRQSILRGIADQTAAVRLPTTVLQQMRRYIQHERLLRHRLGREALPVEVGASLGFSLHQSERLAGLIQSVRTLDNFEISEEMGEISAAGHGFPVPSVEQMIEDQLDQERLESYLRRLSEREETILKMRYGFHDGVAHTLQQTGDRFGISRERVRQIEKRALLKLRRWLENGEGGQAA